MKVWIESRHNKSRIIRLLKKHDVKITRSSPEFVLSYGGDGTLLGVSKDFPKSIIIPIRKSNICARCASFDLNMINHIFNKIEQDEYYIRAFDKVTARVGSKKLTGLNEIQLHNKNPQEAIRFSIHARSNNGIVSHKMIIGDGLIAATAYGSTAYYKTVGYQPFSSGIKIGFNNTNPKPRSIILKGIATIKILRSDGFVFADNSPNFVPVRKHSTIKIKASKDITRFLETE
ncbi:hypothetical protein ACFLQN_03330 [Candidatus Aenigmatarchaeota archaeon]